MTMNEREVGSVVVLELSGKFTSDDTGRLKDKVSSLIYQEKGKIVLDLGGLSYMDSSGLGQMVSCHTTAAEKGGVRLANVGKRLTDLLVMTKLHTVFDVYDTEAEAIASFDKA